MSSALLIIDVQQALCFGPYWAFESKELIERINRVARQARAAGALVVLIQHEAPGRPLAYGTPGWQLAEGLETNPGDQRLRKTTSDSFLDTDLQELLQARGVNHLVVCGLQTEFCVDTTVRRALALGYPVSLVADGHSTTNNAVLTAAQIIAHHNETLTNIGSFGPRVSAVRADDLSFGPSQDSTPG